MRHLAERRAAERAWQRLKETAAQHGSTWLVLGERRTRIIAAALLEVGDLGVEALVLAIEGYSHKTRDWAKRSQYFNPESIFRLSNLAKNVEAGVVARKEAEADQERRAAETRMAESPLWD